GYRFGNGQQIFQIESGVPAGVELAISAYANLARPLPQFSQMLELRLHLGFGPHNADIILHRLLEVPLQCIGIFALALLKWPQRFTDNVFHRSEEHTSELQSRGHLVCRLLLEKKKKKK